MHVIEAVNITTPLDPFLSLKGLAGYSGMSVRKLRDCLTHPVSPLPHYRVDGKILVRRSEFDAWMQAFKHVPDVDRIVNAVVEEFRR